MTTTMKREYGLLVEEYISSKRERQVERQIENVEQESGSLTVLFYVYIAGRALVFWLIARTLFP